MISDVVDLVIAGLAFLGMIDCRRRVRLLERTVLAQLLIQARQDEPELNGSRPGPAGGAMSITLEVIRDLGILEQIIVAVESAKSAKPGDVIGTIKGVKIAGEKFTITVTKE